MRSLAAGLSFALLAHAPMQCTHKPDPALRLEDTAGDALWTLAQQFRARHEDAAARETLEYLVERYPSNRHAPEAKDELHRQGGEQGGGDGGP